MAIEIKKKIVGYEVLKDETEQQEKVEEPAAEKEPARGRAGARGSPADRKSVV